MAIFLPFRSAQLSNFTPLRPITYFGERTDAHQPDHIGRSLCQRNREIGGPD